ncbi:MAG: hypothetical protein J7M14_07680, partial [Planctomycetes bacterium]|nr:hypothetical protein [Planctomycetota bacterium]
MSTINLLPDDYIKRRLQSRANIVCLGLFVVIIVAIICAYWVTSASVRRTVEVRDRINAKYIEATRLIEQMQQLEAQKSLMLQKAQATALLVERVPRSVLLAVITNARPDNTSLLQISLTTTKQNSPAKGQLTTDAKSVLTTQSREEAATAAARIVEMTISGLTTTDANVAKFMANLAN